MDIPGRHSRGRRRKGERKVRVYGNKPLFVLFHCNNTGHLRLKLQELGVDYYYNEVLDSVNVSDYNFPPELGIRPSRCFPWDGVVTGQRKRRMAPGA
jgi:hypothetical protein